MFLPDCNNDPWVGFIPGESGGCLAAVQETGDLPKNSKVKADQIRTLDKSRLVRFIGELGRIEIAAIEKAIKIHLALLTIKQA